MAIVFAVATQKGGVGKSTIALNLAGAICADDNSVRVLVIDADSQNTSTRAAGVGADPLPFRVINLAAAGPNLGREIQLLAKDFDLVIVDCPPTVDNPNTEHAVRIADFVLIPTDASLADWWSSRGMVTLVERLIGKEDRTRCGVVFNRVNTKSASYRELHDAIVADCPYPVLDSTIALREVYKIALGTGTTVFTVKKQRAAKQAQEEIAAVVREIFKIKGYGAENVE
jgi:chromosome partitioning protein